MQQFGGKIHRYKTFHTDEVERKSADQDKCGQDVADFRNHGAESIQLVVQRCLDTIVDLCSSEDLAILRSIAHMCHLHHTVTVCHRSAAQCLIGGISSFFVKFLGISRLAHHRFAGQGRLVDLQGYGFYQSTVGGHLCTRTQDDNISHDDVALGYFCRYAVSHHLHGVFVADGVEQVKGAIGLDFKPKTNTCGQDHGDKDTDGFEEYRSVAVVCAVAEEFEQADAD